MTGFGTRARTDTDSAVHGESHSRYLDRSARHEFESARDRIESWVSRYPAPSRSRLAARLRSDDDQEVKAAYWELYLHELFVRLEFDIECDFKLPNGKDVDFFLHRDDDGVFVEATVAARSVDEQAADKRRDRVYVELDKVSTPGFMLGVEIESAGSADMKNLATLRLKLEQWLLSLDADEVIDRWERLGEGPSYTWTGTDGWLLTFDAFPSKPELRGIPVGRPLGMFSDETGCLIDDERPLLRALQGKRPSRYGTVDVPYVVAINEVPFALGDSEYHRMNTLFGHSALAYGGGLPTRWIREPNGFWRGRSGPQNRRLAAVLLAADCLPWNVETVELEWWQDPFADTPVADNLIPSVARRRYLQLGADGIGELQSLDPVISAGSLLLA